MTPLEGGEGGALLPYENDGGACQKISKAPIKGTIRYLKKYRDPASSCVLYNRKSTVEASLFMKWNGNYGNCILYSIRFSSFYENEKRR